MCADHLSASNRRRIYTVQELNETIQKALQASFPGSVWVKGEVQRLPQDASRRNHVYFELHDTSGGGAANYQIPVALLQWDRSRFGLGKYLDGSDPDFRLRNELEVCLECRVDFYPPFGKLSLRVVGLDKSFTLGQLEALRRRVLAFLEAENLLHKNAEIPLPLLPLRVGLITAAGSAAEQDFRTGLDRSDYGFRVELIDCRMQGEQTAQQVVQALSILARRGVDVVVITRGGGSRGDLSWFDQQDIAVAIAQGSVPVITAIGHEIDRSIADVVAHTSCKTPTAAAEFLVARLDAVAERVDSCAVRLLQVEQIALPRAQHALQNAASRLENQVGRRVGKAREGLAVHGSRLAAAASRLTALAQRDHEHHWYRLTGSAVRRTAAASDLVNALSHRLSLPRLLARLPHQNRRLRRLQGRLARLAPGTVATATRNLDHLTDRAGWLDPERLLARGFTLTWDADGQLLKSVQSVRPGDLVRTRFRDGEMQSQVTRTSPDASNQKMARHEDEAPGGESDAQETQPQQKSLFR